MKLSIGIVGLPNVGKSTLFKLLTSQEILIANYPFATIDPNVGVVPVPDPTLDALSAMSASKKKVPAIVEFYDIAGIVKGASQGEGLGNQFLTHIRDTQAILIVLRAFTDPSIIHVESSVDPLRDMEIILAELALKDLETAEKRLQKLEGEARTGDKEKIRQVGVLKEVEQLLKAGKSVVPLREDPIVEELHLLSAKRELYLINGDEITPELKAAIEARGGEYIVADLGTMTDLSPLIRSAYHLLHLMSFYTTGEDETRAWTIVQGSKAPQAAGVIHTDFENKFIRAEVVNATKLLEAGSWAKARQKGMMRTEGKDYVMQEGDVMEVRHS